MKRKYKTYTDQDFINACQKSISIAGVLRELGLVTAGGNYGQVKRTIQRLKIDVSHWKGQSWSKGEQLKDWSQYTRSKPLKIILIKLRGHCCESCKRKKWLNNKITLELEHIDGDKTNNSFDNLKLLCPNCHSYTPTWRRQKNSLV